MDRVAAVVVGGGAVGCAVAWQLADAGIGSVFLLEKNPRLGEEQSGRSSGVVHAGIYYAEGSLKARLCADANARMYELAADHGIPCAKTGKLVAAPSRDDLPALEEVRKRAAANGVPGVQMLGRRETAALEPALSVEASLLIPTTGIVDAPSLVGTLARLGEEKGAAVLTDFEVASIRPQRGVFEVTGRRRGGAEETLEAEAVVNAAGLRCDEVGRMADPSLDLEVVPLRGEYGRMNRRHRPPLWLTGRNVYPVPEPLDVGGERILMVGAHLTPTFSMAPDGSTVPGDLFTVGPEFRVAPARDDYETDRLPLDFIVGRAMRYMPALDVSDVQPDYAGIMVHLKGAADWIVRRDAIHPNLVQLLGIDSPGLTCCVEIGKLVRNLLAG
ncbi:MAG TPA: FAD-dependent oxidoreductase [Thermoanaerobaculia bacterium]|nr:FAD-dependent oxidoreductase [Thermoanaerobaculia bacterium]HQR66219.1 FAD-dependent oxidoreductase [Thermoanaerobaculia bacterium]